MGGVLHLFPVILRGRGSVWGHPGALPGPFPAVLGGRGEVQAGRVYRGPEGFATGTGGGGSDRWGWVHIVLSHFGPSHLSYQTACVILRSWAPLVGTDPGRRAWNLLDTPRAERCPPWAKEFMRVSSTSTSGMVSSGSTFWISIAVVYSTSLAARTGTGLPRVADGTANGLCIKM